MNLEEAKKTQARLVLTSDLLAGVYGALYKHRWFGKHVDEDEMDELDGELHRAIERVLKERL